MREVHVTHDRSSVREARARRRWVRAVLAAVALLGTVATVAAPPPNDTCAGAIPIPLNLVVDGTTVAANDDYQAPATTACFAGLAGTQNLTTAPGGDVVFTFTAPADGSYSVRQVTLDPNAELRVQNPVLYASDICPSGGGEVNCLLAANRITTNATVTATGANNNQSEELYCMPMIAGQTLYVFFDDGASGNLGGSFGIEATICQNEVEPNDTIATATLHGMCATEGSSSSGATFHCRLGPTPGAACVVNTDCGTGGTCLADGVCVGGPTPGAACLVASTCGFGGTCNRTANEGDVDFWSLGTPPVDSKVYAAIDAPMANDYDFAMRITSTTETLGFDGDDGTSRQGALAPTIAGAKTTGTETFVKISRTNARASEPYRLYAVVHPPISAAQPEGTASGGEGWDITYRWPQDGLFADYLSNGANTGYITGSFHSTSDGDCYKALANEGDDLIWFGDSNPARIAGAGINSNPQVIIYDAAGAGISNFLFATGTSRNIGPFTGNAGLNATTPQSTSFFQHWRARYTGMFELCFYPYPALAAPFPKQYAGSLTANCEPMRMAGPGTTTTEVAVATTGPPGHVATSSVADYTITVTNLGNDIAQEVRLVDTLPPETVFLGMTVDDGFQGNNTACRTLPTVGANDAAIDCTNMSMAPGTVTTYTVSVRVAGCLGGGVTVSNTATITTVSTDPNAGNNSATATLTTSDDGTCMDFVCDADGCSPNLCTVNDRCENGVCIVDPSSCADGNSCTDDVCIPATGACVYTIDDTNSCFDGDLCTTLDTCQSGVCIGSNPKDCSALCPPGFETVAGTCRRTYDIDASLLDQMGPYICPNEPWFYGNMLTSYGFHWTDLGGGLSGVLRVDVQLGLGVKCTIGSSSFTLNGTPAGQFNRSGTCDCTSVRSTLLLPDLNVGAYVKGGLNVFSVTPGSAFANVSEALHTRPDLGGNFARVTVTYLPPSWPGGSCTGGACDPGTGTCRFSSLPDGAACSDGNACNGVETCQQLPLATCTSGSPVTCDAPPVCHTAVGAACDTGTGDCTYPTSADGTECDDGNLCTAADTCSAGVCASGPPAHCDDGNLCTIDDCSPTSGCEHTPIDCSDGDGCTLDSCSDPGGCQHTSTCTEGPGLPLSDGKTTSTDSEGDGATPSDQIETTVTTPSGGAVTIQEGPATGSLPTGYALLDLQSVIEAPNATFDNPLVLVFRIDASTLPSGYVLSFLTIFRNGVLVPECTGPSRQAIPDPCVSSRIVRGDGDVQVTVLTSVASTWNLGFPDCDDGNPCTDDVGVYPACTYANNAAPCSDGNACTLTDTCQGGACQGGNAVVCAGSDSCHVAGVCDPGTGACSNPAAADGTACSDGNACSQTDTCQAGHCTGTNYSWSGVLQPINADGSSVFKLGSTVPTKFRLTGACAGNPNLVAHIYFFQTSNLTGPVNEAVSTSGADTGTVFRYSASDDQYIYNLGTKGLSSGDWRLRIDLGGGKGIQEVEVGLRK